MNKSEAKLRSSLRRKEAKLKGKIERQKIRTTADAQATINKSKTTSQRIKEANQTKRYLAKQTAIAASANAASSAFARSKEAEYQASIAKYAALVNGNTNGTNAIDPGKDGDNGSGDTSTNNPKPRWP